MMQKITSWIHGSLFLFGVLLMTMGPQAAKAEDTSIDASDPTRIYSYAGGGIKYTDYTNGEEMWEGRITGNLGLTDQDMILFEAGYGHHSGDKLSGKSSDFTNARARWFHVFEMNYEVTQGYRGWATQVDFQIAGGLKGTDGSNTLSVGALPAFGLNANWSFFLPVNVVNVWEKDFAGYSGLGLSIAPLLVYSPDNWWKGAYIQCWPNYVRFISGDLKNEGSGNFDLTIGGAITPTMFWGVTYQKNFDKNLSTYRRGQNTGLTNDQNIFISITTYF